MSPDHQSNRKVAMTQPIGDGGNAAPTNQNTPQDPATGPTAPTNPPSPPGFQPATSSPDAGQPAQPATKAGADADNQGDPGQLGEGGKKALQAEREARKAAEDARKAAEEAAKKQAKQMADLEQKLNALQPAAELFAQFRKVAVPDEEKTDTERLQEQIGKLQEETQTERVQRWRLEIATDKGLTREQAAELRGSTQEELAAHADRLLALFPQAPPPAPAPQPNGDAAPTPEPTAEPAAQQATPNGPKPDPSQGARGPVDLSAQIEDALAKGDIKTSIALKQQMRLQQANQ